MLTGKPPFPGGVRPLMKEVGAELTLDLSLLPPSTPDEVIGILRKSLAAYPSDRYATARAMTNACSVALERLDAAAA